MTAASVPSAPWAGLRTPTCSLRSEENEVQVLNSHISSRSNHLWILSIFRVEVISRSFSIIDKPRLLHGHNPPAGCQPVATFKPLKPLGWPSVEVAAAEVQDFPWEAPDWWLVVFTRHNALKTQGIKNARWNQSVPCVEIDSWQQNRLDFQIFSSSCLDPKSTVPGFKAFSTSKATHVNQVKRQETWHLLPCARSQSHYSDEPPRCIRP